jgi:hypothetical protein
MWNTLLKLKNCKTKNSLFHFLKHCNLKKNVSKMFHGAIGNLSNNLKLFKRFVYVNHF